MSTFNELIESNPCVGCPAPCCRMLLLPHSHPRTLKEIDHMRYVLLFENSEVAVSINGEWSVVKWQKCTLFEENSCTCSVHGTPKKPLICQEFSPYQCWYKRNYVEENNGGEIYRLNLERFEALLKEISFDEGGMITLFPSFEQAKEIVEKITIEPRLQINVELKK
ncbi:YkgJ family cysteine cluster protein [Microcystis aeruginosa]|jgi:hypothetical protein|uniref:YkgJ family cysteine cluster protein n=1 Tax=Microcystis aeruginosa TaxID=1126 RepID=UPI000906FEBA|nr:YkgJ family cysteine cluster protein [Microcystis aeruginosa]MDB9394464.1 YkgJ family cysteine cluster protein [Microcystis aeruginosa CS-573]